jgi:hypothetical protein
MQSKINTDTAIMNLKIQAEDIMICTESCSMMASRLERVGESNGRS